MASEAISQLRNDLGSEYSDYTDNELAQALHLQYQGDTGDTVDFKEYASAIGFEPFTPPDSSDSLRATDSTNMIPATAGNFDTANMTQEGRQIVGNKDGSFSTEITHTVTDPSINNGAPTNIPTMFGGRKLSEPEAIRIIADNNGIDPETGKKLEGFNSIDEAVTSAENRTHELGAVRGFSLASDTDFSRKLGALELPEDPWIDVLQKNVERIPERVKQLGGALMDITSPVIDPLLGKREGHEGATRVASQKIWNEADEKIKANQPNLKHGTAKYYASAIFNATADMGFAVAASTLTKNPNIGLAVMTSQVFVDKKAQSLSEGKSEDRANLDAVFYSMTEGLTEKVPLGILTKEGGKWLNRTLKSMGAEGLQEIFAESAQIGYERGIWDEGEELSLGQMAQRLWDAGIIGMGTGGTLAVITHPLTDSPEKALGREMLTMVEQVNLAVDDMDTATKFAPPQNNAQAVYQQAVKDTPKTEPVVQPDVPPIEDVPDEVIPDTLVEETDVSREELTQVTPEEKPVYHKTIDTRFPEYEVALESLASGLVEGGDISLVDDPDYKPGESDKPGEVPQIRTKSVNPEWFQVMATETGLSVKAVKNAVQRAKLGKRLGKQQAKAIETMIDYVADEGGQAPRGKAPWEMTKEEFGENHFIRGIRKDGSKDGLAEKASLFDDGHAKKYASGEGGYYRVFNEKDLQIPHEAATKDTDRSTKGAPSIGDVPGGVDPHRYLVEQAILNGEKVPDAVLSQYPDIKATPETPKVAEPAKKAQREGQAKAGGEWGLNGEWYAGGQFMPASAFTVKGAFKVEKRAGTGRTLVAPGEWAIQPEGTRSVFGSISHYIQDAADPKAALTPESKVELSPKAEDFPWDKNFSRGIEEAQELVDLWNKGVRFVDMPAETTLEAAKKPKAKKKPKKRDDGTQASRTGDIQSVWAPGATYVPMLRGRAISDIEEEVAKVPDKPIRREHIIKKMERLFGVKIYQGRVKGKTRLGFFRASNSELRIKNHNDLEVTAHEVTHWLDDRYKEFARAYKRKPFKQELLGISYDVDNIKEGFAEFGRLYMTQEHEAVLRAPLFYDKFVSIMESEGIRDNVDDIKDSMHQWYNQGALGRFRSKIGKDVEPIRQRIAAATDGFSDTAIASTFDALHGIKVAEADLLGTIGAADLSPYKSTRLTAGARAVTKVVLERGTIAFDENGDVYFTGKGLRQVFEPVADIFEDTMMYFAARRASELMKQGREHHFEEAEIKAALKLGEENPVMKEVFDEYQAFNSRMMDFYVQSGLLNKESRKAMEEMNKDYVPFFRIQEEITGDIVTRRTPFKRLTGGTANVDDIFDNITFGTATLIREALLNRAKQRTYSMLDNAKGGAKYAVKIPTDIKMTEIERTQVEDAFLKGLGLNPKDYRASQKMHMSDPSIDQMLEMITSNLSDFVGFFTFGHAPQGNNIDSVMIDGKRVFYEVADPLFMKAMNSLGGKPMHLALRIGAGFKNTLTRGVTSMPDFQMVNLIRDSFNGFALSEGGITPLISSLKGAYEKIIKDDAYWEFMANGGGYSSTVHGETQATRRHLEHLYNSHGIDYKTVLDTPQKMMDMWDEFTSAFEYGTRLAEYKAMRKKGASKQEAAFQGREISTDFAMRGYSEFLKVFTTTVPFLNARMQGLYKLEREGFEKGGKQSRFGDNAGRLAVRGLGAITLPSLLLYLLNKDDERYTALPEWVKDLHWVILIPGKENAYLIPKPFEVGAVFATIPERMLQVSIEKKGKRFGDAMFRILKDTFNLDPTPQIIKPLVETEATNRRFTGAPIVPEDLKGVESWEQFRPYTAESMVALGKETGLSPMKLEHLVRGYLGTLGMYLLMGADGLINDQRGGEAPTKRLDQMPIVRRWIRQQPYRNTSYSDQFYEVAEQTRKITKTFGKIQKEGRANDLNEYLGEGNRELLFGMNAAVSDFVSEFSSINGAIRQARADTKTKPDEKRKAVDKLLKTRNQVFKAASEVLDLDEIKNLKRRVKDFE